MSVKVHLIPNIIKNILSNGSTNCKTSLFDSSGRGGIWLLPCFGVAVGLCGYGMCQMCGAIRRGTLLKNAKGRPLLFRQPSLESFTCPHGKSLLESRQPFCLKTNLSWPYGWQRLCISSGGSSKRVTVPRHQTYFEKLNYKFTLNPAIDYARCCGLGGLSTWFIKVRCCLFFCISFLSFLCGIPQFHFLILL